MPSPNAPITDPVDPGTPGLPDPDGEEGGLKALRDQLDRQEQELNALKNRPAAPAQPQPGGPMPGPTKEQLEAEFWKNPVEVSSALAMRAAQEFSANAVMPHLDTLIAVARTEARNSCKNPEIFDKYSAEIEAKLAQVHPQYRTNINVWKNAANNVFGEHIDDIAKTMGSKVVLTSDGPALPSPRAAAAPKTAADKLSDEQKLWAGRLGLTPEQYAHGLEVVNDPDKWEQVITLDSEQARRRHAAASANK